MEESTSKPWYKSKTIIASVGSLLVSIATLVLALNGVSPDSMIATSVISAVTTSVAIWGRIVASEMIGAKPKEEEESG